MGETEKRELLTISPEWSIPQLQEKIAVALAKTFNPAMCEVGRSKDQESPGVAPRYLWAAFATGNNQSKFVAEDIALVVETSGSTGEPKLVNSLQPAWSFK